MSSPSSPESGAMGETTASFVTPDAGDDLLAKHLNEAVKDPTPSDVLCGRGGSINSHPGNELFRTLVEKRKRVYLTARFKREKRLIASSIVQQIRELDPPGRFLLRDSKSGLWKDIGDEKARDKTSQALRENAPSIRAEIETEVNEQRMELKREEDKKSFTPSSSGSPHAASPPSYYPGWGYHSYYGYSHHAPPPPPPPGHPSGPPPPGYDDGAHYPPPAPTYFGFPYGPPPPTECKSALEKTADYFASSAESIKNWTMSVGSASIPSSSSHESRASTASQKPIVYIHEDDSRKRRMVKFSDDRKYRRKHSSTVVRPSYSPIHHSNNSMANSIMEHHPDEDEEEHVQVIEPHKLDASPDYQSSSLMTQFANQVLGSLGSWDAAATLCGYEHADDGKVPFPNSRTSGSQHDVAEAPTEEEEVNMEWEAGQEVQLLEKTEYDSVNSDERMPPPVVRRTDKDTAASSIAFSSLGSCHSWIPEQFGSSAASFFGRNPEDTEPAMDMEYSAAGTEPFSAVGSVGGGSLTRVFESETQQYSMHGSSHASPLASGHYHPSQYHHHQQQQSPPHPYMNHRELSQMPSWERSVRSRSPLSIESEDKGDDESSVSKGSSKLSDGLLARMMPSPHGLGDDGRMWGSRE